MDASIFDLVLSHTRRLDASEKRACPLLDVFACGKVSRPRLYRLNVVMKISVISSPSLFTLKILVLEAELEVVQFITMI